MCGKWTMSEELDAPGAGKRLNLHTALVRSRVFPREELSCQPEKSKDCSFHDAAFLRESISQGNW